MHWKKLGQIFDPRKRPDIARSHAQVPTVTVLPDRLRVFFADRTAENRSFVTWIDVARRDPSHILGAAGGAVLESAEAGMFDDDGMMPGDVVREGDALWMYYTGWNRGVTVPYRNSIGIAVSRDGGSSFRRMFHGPVLDRVPLEPLMAVTPSVFRDGALWRMWYASGTRWATIDGTLEPVYVIRYAESHDGINWSRSGRTAIEQRHELEALAHPSVLRVGDRYHMWFSYRDSRDYRTGIGSYRIGYACSTDGLSWVRNDDCAGIKPSPDGWDSAMICYPYLVTVDEQTYMFYNGNGFGRSGIGYAVLE